MNQTNLTYDVHFNNGENSNNKGFAMSVEECRNYISQKNGSDTSYFKDYKGGSVSIICNETGNTVHSESVK